MNDTIHSISTRGSQRVCCKLGTEGQPFAHISLVEFTADGVTCAACLDRIAAKRARLDEIAAERAARTPLIDQIKADMLRRNPRLADPEWAVEDYRTPRNRR